jgi:serine protease Do
MEQLMNTRSRTLASLFSVAMAAMLVGAVVTSQVQRPVAAQASPGSASGASSAQPAVSVTLDTFRDIARARTKGVVNINTSKVVKRRSDPFRDFFGGGDNDMMDRFFGPHGGSDGNGSGRTERETQRALGSGFIIDKDGYILTNRHVIEGADQISVTLNDGKSFDAKLVGRDPRTDVALLKIEPTEALTALELGDSDQTEVGEWVMAIGNPFGLSGNSVTVGVVSYKGRPLTLGVPGTGVDMIQTDAAINPGNSGGPLLNTRGQVIGINTLIITQGVPQSAGVGFAVPSNVAKEVLPQLREKGRVVRGWLGVQIQAISQDLAKSLKMKEPKGAIVSDVTSGAPAEKAGVKPGDVVIGVDGRGVADNNDLSRYIASKSPNTSVRLKLLREGSEKEIAVTLGTFPDAEEDSDTQEASKAQLGMTLRDLTPDVAERLEMPRGTKGAVVMSVEAGDAAEEALLQRGDVIVSVNGSPIESVSDFEKEIGRAKADGLARLRVRRGPSHVFLILKLK